MGLGEREHYRKQEKASVQTTAKVRGAHPTPSTLPKSRS